jgi:hypothetical protein
LVGKSKGKSPLGRPSHKIDNNIKMGYKKIGWEYGLDSFGSG